jgi:Sec-independent protein secretion pathway component TatC
MIIMAIPVYLLYELSIWLVWAIQRRQSKEDHIGAGTRAAPAE